MALNGPEPQCKIDFRILTRGLMNKWPNFVWVVDLNIIYTFLNEQLLRWITKFLYLSLMQEEAPNLGYAHKHSACGQNNFSRVYYS